MNGVGAPEAVMVVVLGLFWMIPLVAFGWALYALHRIRQSQLAIIRRLETIEGLVRKSP